MLNLVQPIREEVAQEATTPWIKRLLETDQEAMPQAHESHVQALEDRGVTPAVALAYLEVAPAMLEQEAVAKVRARRPMMAAALPEINNVDEAVALAIQDRALSESQASELRELLNFDSSRQKLTVEQIEDKAREKLRAKIGHLNTRFDFEIASDGLRLSGYHIEAGARSFGQYARVMIEDLGDGIRPYLKYLYHQVRDYPGFESEGMESREETEDVHIDAAVEQARR